MAQVAVETKGVDGLRKAFERFGKGGRKVLRGAMEQALRPAFDETQERVPVESGRLKRTGRISIRAGEKQVTAKILYGGDLAPYALKVHEDLEASHPNGGQSKFVESVVRGYPFLQHLASLVNLTEVAKG